MNLDGSSEGGRRCAVTPGGGEGSERFMTWHKSGEEASRQRAAKRVNGPRKSTDTATTKGTADGQTKDESAREESRREEAKRVDR